MTDYCRKTKRGTAESCLLCFCPQRHCIYLVLGDYITQKVVHDALNSECLLALASRELVFMGLKASGPILWNYCSPSYFVSLVFLGVTSFKLLLIYTKLHWWWEKWIMLCVCCFEETTSETLHNARFGLPLVLVFLEKILKPSCCLKNRQAALGPLVWVALSL